MHDPDDIEAFTAWADELSVDDQRLLDEFLGAAGNVGPCSGEFAVLRDLLTVGPWRDRAVAVDVDAFLMVLVPIAAMARDWGTGAGPLELWQAAMEVLESSSGCGGGGSGE